MIATAEWRTAELPQSLLCLCVSQLQCTATIIRVGLAIHSGFISVRFFTEFCC